MVSRFFLALVVLALGMAGANITQVYAQSPKASKLKTAWPVACKKQQVTNKKQCKMVQRILVKKTGKLLISASINKAGKKRDKAVMLLQLPTGLFLPSGVAVQIDKGKAITAVIQTCDVRGCFAGIPLSAKMLTAMKKGNVITVAFKNLKKQTIAIGLTLKGFSAALKKV